MDDDDERYFEKFCTVSSREFTTQCCHSAGPESDIMAFIVRSGDLVIYSLRYDSYKPTVRWFPWFDDPRRKLIGVSFNPTGGEGLLLACSDCSFYVLPILTLLGLSQPGDPNNFSENTNDILKLPSPNVEWGDFLPTAITWWTRSNCAESSRHVAVVGSSRGEIIVFTMSHGSVIFKTTVDGCVTKLEVFRKSDSYFIVITNELEVQWMITVSDVSSPTAACPSNSVLSGSEGKLNENASKKSVHPSEQSKADYVNFEKIPSKREFQLDVRMRMLSSTCATFKSNLVVGAFQANLVNLDDIVAGTSTLHKLPPRYGLISMTNFFFVISSDSYESIQIVSKHLSSSKIDNRNRHLINMDFNGDSLFQEFLLMEDEKVLAIFCSTSENEQCSVVTNMGVYALRLKKKPYQLVLNTILCSYNENMTEKLSDVFGLDLQKLICEAGDIKLSKGFIEEAKHLYSLSRNGSTHHVMMLAINGFFNDLLRELQTCKFNTSNKYHITNLKLLVLVYKYLTSYSAQIHSELRDILKTGDYDEALAVSIIAQAGLCRELHLLMKIKGVQLTVMSTIANMVQHKYSVDIIKCEGFWELFTDRSLNHALITKPSILYFHSLLVQKHLLSMTEDELLGLEELYNPLQSTMRSFVASVIQSDVPLKLWIETYLLNCIQLSSKKKIFVKETLHIISKKHSWEFIEPKLPFVPRAIGAGFRHSFVIISGNCYGWGNTSNGCLGIGPTNLSVTGPKPLESFCCLKKAVIALSCGRNHTLALTNNGVYSWGNNKYGQLGSSHYVQSSYPTLIEKLGHLNIISVSAGQYHSLALDDENRVYSWGWGIHGQLGHGNVEDVREPKLVTSLTNKKIQYLGAGHAHSLFLDSSGHVWACGSNAFGQLGIGECKKSTSPVKIHALCNEIVEISAGYFQNCAVAADGKLYQWGRSPNVLRTATHSAKRRQRSEENAKEHSALVDENSEYLTPKLVDTSGLDESIFKVSSGSEHSVILTRNGTVYSWGRNIDGQLGISASVTERRTQNLTVPVAVTSIGSKVIDIACGSDYTVAVDASGIVWTWGANHYCKGARGSLAGLEGEIVVVNNKNRVIKLPHSSNNVQPVPTLLKITPKEREIPRYSPPKLPRVLRGAGWRERMHFTLEQFAQYYSTTLKQQCLLVGEYDACSKISQLSGDFSEAALIKLKSAESTDEMGFVLNFYLQKESLDADKLKLLVVDVVKHWYENNLPFPVLENIYLKHMNLVAHHLGALLFRTNNEMSEMFTTHFKLRLVKNMLAINRNNMDCVIEGFTNVEDLVKALQASDDFIDISAAQIQNSCSKLNQKTFLSL